jgi:hypothetical protein
MSKYVSSMVIFSPPGFEGSVLFYKIVIANILPTEREVVIFNNIKSVV